IKKPRVEVSRTLDVSCSESDGVEIVKEALESFEKMGTKDNTVEVSYLGAPHYRLKIVAEDYKSAEKTLQAILKVGTEDLKKRHCTVAVVEGAK
ncbi:MAG: hypothetical protein V1909_02810, partial [Candidatus Micrarchaeota archaeon]